MDVNKQKPMSRRSFAKKSTMAMAAIGLTGYGIYNARKIRSLNDMLQMGHCAPSIMQTLLETNLPLCPIEKNRTCISSSGNVNLYKTKICKD